MLSSSTFSVQLLDLNLQTQAQLCFVSKDQREKSCRQSMMLRLAASYSIPALAKEKEFPRAEHATNWLMYLPFFPKHESDLTHSCSPSMFADLTSTWQSSACFITVFSRVFPHGIIKLLLSEKEGSTPHQKNSLRPGANCFHQSQLQGQEITSKNRLQAQNPLHQKRVTVTRLFAWPK